MKFWCCINSIDFTQNILIHMERAWFHWICPLKIREFNSFLIWRLTTLAWSDNLWHWTSSLDHHLWFCRRLWGGRCSWTSGFSFIEPRNINLVFFLIARKVMLWSMHHTVELQMVTCHHSQSTTRNLGHHVWGCRTSNTSLTAAHTWKRSKFPYHSPTKSLGLCIKVLKYPP